MEVGMEMDHLINSSILNFPFLGSLSSNTLSGLDQFSSLSLSLTVILLSLDYTKTLRGDSHRHSSKDPTFLSSLRSFAPDFFPHDSRSYVFVFELGPSVFLKIKTKKLWSLRFSWLVLFRFWLGGWVAILGVLFFLDVWLHSRARLDFWLVLFAVYVLTLFT